MDSGVDSREMEEPSLVMIDSVEDFFRRRCVDCLPTFTRLVRALGTHDRRNRSASIGQRSVVTGVCTRVRLSKGHTDEGETYVLTPWKVNVIRAVFGKTPADPFAHHVCFFSDSTLSSPSLLLLLFVVVGCAGVAKMLSRVATAGARGALRARLPTAGRGRVPLIQPAFQTFHAGERGGRVVFCV